MDDQLLAKFREVRALTEQHCQPLTTEDYVPQVVEFASPPLWHLAHTTWFFEQMILVPFLEGYTIYHKDFSFLFNSYYDTVGERNLRNRRGAITRPGVDEVYKYRAYVDLYISNLLSQSNSEEIEALIILGLNHEQQHQELLLTDLKLAFSYNPLNPVYSDKSDFEFPTQENSAWIDFDEGINHIGHDGNSFCFDNELGSHKVFTQKFSISNQLVTNGEYLEFINSRGYEDVSLWLNEGWKWVTENKQDSPLYWKNINNEWQHFTLSGLNKLDLNAAVCHVNFYEANAYASWKGLRLPTEFEWEVASKQINWGTRWEWTNSAYLPYPNFSKSEGAVGEYNGKFMINQMVLRGSSVATSPGHERPTYRNFFHPEMQWQYSGIRLAK